MPEPEPDPAPPIAAFRAARYEAAGVVARIGARSAAMDALLARHRVRQGGFVTAWNPLSRRYPPGWNRRRQDMLRQAARRLLLEEGFGSASGGAEHGADHWAEHHLLLAGDPRRLLVLARRFRQWAIVTVARGRPARLRLALQPGSRPSVGRAG